jgi:hypothetical protein
MFQIFKHCAFVYLCLQQTPIVRNCDKICHNAPTDIC